MNKNFKDIAKNHFITVCMQNSVCNDNDLAEIIKYGYNLALEDILHMMKQKLQKILKDLKNLYVARNVIIQWYLIYDNIH